MKKRLIAALLSLALLPSSFAQTLPDLGDAAAAELSPQAERKLGESIMRDIRWRDAAYLNDPEVEAYLNRLGTRLVAASPGAQQDFDFFAVRDASLNAFALPGGHIGVHTGLLITAQSESELASVLSHEIAHVTQRHIARMVGQQSQTSMVMLASLLLAVLAARNSSQVSQAAIMGGQAATLQSQLSYSRDFENEADRIGLQTLDAAGFDIRGMPAFFERLQKNSRLYENNAPAYLRTHPLTTDRITEMENRVFQRKYRQVPDSLEFHLVRAKLRADRGSPTEAVSDLKGQLEGRGLPQVAAQYGLARALMRAGRLDEAERTLALARKTDASPMLDGLAVELRMARRDFEGAARTAKEARVRFPHARSLVYQQAQALLAANRAAEALAMVRPELAEATTDVRLWELQAQAQAALGKRVAQHRSVAEVYALKDNYSAAVEQLELAQRAGDGDFFDLSAVDARLRELRVLQREQMKEMRGQK